MSNPSPTGWPLASSPYHPGEQMVQERAGARGFAERIGRQVIRDHMPEQHREFFGLLPYLFIGTLDAQGRPWASVLAGAPGFVGSPEPRRLRIAARPVAGDPACANLAVGVPIAAVGVQFHTRRRNRVNGRVAASHEGGIEFEVTQSFGNCPQYIQSREASPAPQPQAAPSGAATTEAALLSERARRLIASADTFFIASASPAARSSQDPVEGVDVNHRGGRPGFVEVADDNGASVVAWPDFVGNSAFNTLGNITLNPVAGLLFIDFRTGDTLSLTGRADIVWEAAEVRQFAGAERVVRLRVNAGVYIERALPLAWGGVQYAPQLKRTGTWLEAQQARSGSQSGGAVDYRPLVVTRVREESETVKSFFLRAQDARPLVPHVPGQFLPLRLRVAGDELRRTFTISNPPGQGEYRITIKRAAAGGFGASASQWLHDHAREGTVLQAAAPRGDFVLDTRSQRPVVFISAGIGITPMVAMVDDLLSASTERPRNPDRPVWFLHFVRNGRDQVFAAHLQALRDRRPNLQLHVRFSDPLPHEHAGIDCDSVGMIDAPLLQSLLPPAEYDFLLCGPAGFMQTAYDLLRGLGVADQRIRSEAFGPAALRRTAPQGEPAAAAPSPPIARARVHLQRSGLTLAWQRQDGSLLDAAEAAGATLPWSCRNGSCGTCKAALVSGEVTYEHPVAAHVAPGEVLLCCARAASPELVLDA